MLSLNGIRVVRGEEGVAFAGADQDLPDLRDPATLGCLLALVRDAWPTAPATTARYTCYSPERGSYSSWACTYWQPDADSPHVGAWIHAPGETEAEALVAALEAAGGGE
jgi:hypothetical protein